MLPPYPHDQPSRGLDAASVLPLDRKQGEVGSPCTHRSKGVLPILGARR